MAKEVRAEVWLAVDEDGDYVVGATREDAVGAADTDKAYRLVRVQLTVPVPEVIAVAADLVAAELRTALVAAAVA